MGRRRATGASASRSSGPLSTWLPWLQYDDRPIFLFYAIAILPFLVLADLLCLGRLIGPPGASTRRRTVGVVVAGSFVVLVLLNFAWFWPIWTDQLLTRVGVAGPDLVRPLDLSPPGPTGQPTGQSAREVSSASSGRQVLAKDSTSRPLKCSSSWCPP